MMQLSQYLERTRHKWAGVCEEEEFQLQTFTLAHKIGCELL